MIVFDGVKSDFLSCVESDSIAETIEASIFQKMGRHTGKAEFHSWENSLEYMYRVLNDPNIPSDAGIAIEYNIPQTSKRIDFMITGYDEMRQPNLVIVELKQWQELTEVTEVSDMDALVDTFTGGAVRRVVHPAYQVWSYAQLIRDYNATVQDRDIAVRPCACLHNYVRKTKDPLDAERYQPYLEEAPAFTRGQLSNLRDFIKQSVKYGDKKEVLYLVDHGKIRPSKSLQNAIASMLKGNREFLMIDDQKVVYESILKLSEQYAREKKKCTIIVKGGPGTGKTVVAVNLLAELTQRGQMVQYVSKNSAPRQVYLEKLKGSFRKNCVDNMFKGSGTYHECPANTVTTLLVDEAHRLVEKGMYVKEGNQIREIIRAAYCSVFFLDENQRVTMEDIGSEAEIKKWANEEESKVIEMELLSQFRCNGSDGYLAWVDNVLEIRETANFDLEGIDYDIQILDTPQEVREIVVEKNRAANRARILAGYCWNWPKEGRNDTHCHDIKIGDFEISWNLSGDTFATSETSIGEAGCIHTSQGLEFDYVGVIIGDDLRFNGTELITDPSKRAKTDKSLDGYKKLLAENPALAQKRAEEIIKNTYRTLLTRGMKGCYVYCTDRGLSEYLKGCVNHAKRDVRKNS